MDARLQGSIIFAAAAKKPAKSWDRGKLYPYIVRRLRTGRPSDETPWLPNKLYRTESDEIHWLPNKEMTKLSGSVTKLRQDLFPHFPVSDTLQCDTSTLNLRLGGSGPVALGPLRG